MGVALDELKVFEKKKDIRVEVEKQMKWLERGHVVTWKFFITSKK